MFFLFIPMTLWAHLKYFQCLFFLFLWLLWAHLNIFSVYSSYSYDAVGALKYLQCLFFLFLWLCGRTYIFSVFILLILMTLWAHLNIFSVYSSYSFDSVGVLKFFQCIFFLFLWLCGHTVKGTQAWEIFCLWFWILYYFIVSYA